MKTKPAFLLLCLLLLLACPARAQDSEAQDREECKRNLKLIYEAIQAYKADHGEVPEWLSALVPQYVADPNIFICPVSKKTGQTEASDDPKLTTSYLYLFSPAPIGKSEFADPSVKTHRDYSLKLLQSIGPVVPMVRCLHHGLILSLAYDGTIYQSPLPAAAKPARPPEAMKGNAPAKPGADTTAPAGSAMEIPRRDPAAGAEQVDLSDFYNAALTQSWLSPSNDLSTFPSGLRLYGGIYFDARGIIQLSGASKITRRFPAEVKSIPVRKICQRLSFLHAAAYGDKKDNGTLVGTYVIHYATNHIRAEIPIRYGTELENWHGRKQTAQTSGGPNIVWTGSTPVSRQNGNITRLFVTTWTNLIPNVTVEDIEFVSAQATPAPFLLAITAE